MNSNLDSIFFFQNRPSEQKKWLGEQTLGHTEDKNIGKQVPA